MYQSYKKCEVENRFRNIDSKKSTSMDKIPPKLIKLSSKVLSKRLANAINDSCNKRLFPSKSVRFCLG